MAKSLFLSNKYFEDGCNWPRCCWTDCHQTVVRLRNQCGTVEVYHDGYYIGTEMFVWVKFSTHQINQHDENVNDYRCWNIWIVHRLEVTYRRNQMHHWAGWCCACSPQFHTTKPSTVAILISLPMMISNDHSSCIFINVHTGDHSQLCRKL